MLITLTKLNWQKLVGGERVEGSKTKGCDAFGQRFKEKEKEEEEVGRIA